MITNRKDFPHYAGALLTKIGPPKRWSPLNLRELWEARDLCYFLVWRDVKVRYAQAALGFGWAVVQPVLMMVVFTIFLGGLADIPSEGFPYPVFALTGLVPWAFFMNAVGSSTGSLVANSNLVSKVYFPRLVVPLASMLAWLPDLMIGVLIAVTTMLIYGFVPSWTIVFLPLFALGALATAASVGFWLSALNVAYRDVRYGVTFLLQLWLFATPVVYPLSLVDGRFHTLLGLNPMTGVVEGFRWALLKDRPSSWVLIGVSGLITCILLIGGSFFFRRREQEFADII